MVLPQAEPKRDHERHRADDQAGAQLVEMVHEAEPVLVADRANRCGHGSYETTTATSHSPSNDLDPGGPRAIVAAGVDLQLRAVSRAVTGATQTS